MSFLLLRPVLGDDLPWQMQPITGLDSTTAFVGPKDAKVSYTVYYKAGHITIINKCAQDAAKMPIRVAWRIPPASGVDGNKDLQHENNGAGQALLAPMGMQGSTFTGWAFSAYPLPWKAGLTCPGAGTDRPTCDSWDDLAKSTDCALPMKDGAYNIYGVFTCPDSACTGRRTGSMWDTRKDDTRKQLVAY
jgi:hypothetical protein